MTYSCPKCGYSMRMQVQAVISAPSDLAHQLGKRNLRRKDVYLMGVLWETADHICDNPDCRHVLDGYGNYVTKLKKENERMQEVLRNIGDLAHDVSTGPAAPDHYWEIRKLAYEYLRQN